MSEATERAREIVSGYDVQGAGRRVEVGNAMADYIEALEELVRSTYPNLHAEAKRKFEEATGIIDSTK